MYDVLKLRNQLCFPLYACSKEIVRHYTPYLDEINLTYTQYLVMMYLWENNKSNVKILGEALFLDSGTLTPILKKLEEKGYIIRSRDKIDERNLNIEITKSGMKLREKALKIPMEIGSCINLTEEEAKFLYQILYKIIKNVEER